MFGSTLLFPSAPHFDACAYLERLNDALPAGVGAFDYLEVESAALHLFRNEAFTVRVEISEEPEAPTKFASALISPASQRLMRLSNDVRRHRATLKIAVALPDAATAMNGDATPGQDAKAAENRLHTPQSEMLRLKVLHLFTHTATRMTRPLVVHWEQSNRLLTALEVGTAEMEEIPYGYCFSPRPFSSGAKQYGSALVGFRAVGAEMVLGRALIVHETTLPLAQGCDLAADLIRVFHRNSRPRADSVLRLDGHPAMQIRRRPPSGAFRSGTIEVTVDESTIGLPSRPEDALRDAFNGQSATASARGRQLPPIMRGIARIFAH